MKNKLKYFILILFIFNNFYSSYAYAEEIKFDDIKFEAKKIEYFNQENLIKASGKVKIFLDNDTEVSAEKFTYDKSNSHLIIEENVIIDDLKNDIYLKSNKINYLKKKKY